MKRLILLLMACCILLSGTYMVGAQEATIVSTGKPDIDYSKTVSYTEYLNHYKNALKPEKAIEISAESFTKSEHMNPVLKENYNGNKGKSLLTGDDGYVEWTVEVPEEGLYNIAVEYCPVAGRASSIEREIYIDGVLPFESAVSVLFNRIWKNSSETILQDSAGNEYRPLQVEEEKWVNSFVSGTTDYRDESYYFYFSKGMHTIRFTSVKEPMLLKKIVLCQDTPSKGYQEKMAELSKEGKTPKPFDAVPIKIQGEKALYKSDATLYPLADFSSPANEPFDYTKSVLNTIGGENWKYQGQWLEWDFTVEKSGFYAVSFRAKQNYKSGSYSCRELSIDGKVPFEQASKIRFVYDLGWQLTTLYNEKNEPCYIYIEAGKHTLRLNVALGDQAEVLRKVQECVTRLNGVYRKILMITGTYPDPLRDYNIDKQLPDAMVTLKECSDILYEASEMLSSDTGKGSESAQMDKTAYLLKNFVEDPGSIPARLDTFNSGISELGSWVLTTTEQPLTLDYVLLTPPETKLPKADVAWYVKFYNETVRLVLSFFNDYDMIGDDTQNKKESVNLWIGTGRDQALVMKSILNNSFTKSTGIPVAMKLVNMEILLRAVSAGEGPDLAFFQEQTNPVNYAFRGALYDLSEFQDLPEVLKSFHGSAVEPFRIGDSVYALPEQQSFNVMFYRKDVLEELGFGIPQTWDDIYALLPELQKNNMEIGVPSPFASGTSATVNSMYLQFLYQNGGTIYNSEKSKCVLDSEVGIKAFEQWASLYTKYKIPQKVDILTRFRIGECPIVITPFIFYNQLYVAASEIRGLWGMTLIPGTTDKNGTINRATAGGVTGAIMFKNAKNVENTWALMKWWVSKDAQVMYGREIEALLGQSGRWCTANIEAMYELAWPTKDAKIIGEQWKSVLPIPEVAGGYYTGRNVDNAIRTVVNSGENAKETLLDNVKIINDEIKLKRREFGLEQ